MMNAAICPANGSSTEEGQPLLRYYPPKEYRSSDQVFSITQDTRGVIFFLVPASQLIIAYNGASWEPHQLSFSPRELAVDDEGTVYVTGYGDLGYMEIGDQGMQFVSLRPLLPESLSDEITAPIIAAGHGRIYFMDRRHLLAWDGVGFTVVSAEEEAQLGGLTVSGDRVLLWQRGLGASTWHPETGEHSPFGPRLNLRLFDIQAGWDNDLLLATVDGKIVQLTSDTVTSFSPQAEQIIAGRSIFELNRINDGRLLVGAAGAGLLILDQAGRVEAHFDTQTGLPNNTVYRSFIDRQGSIWLGLAKGLARISGEPVSVFGPAAPFSLAQDVIRFHGDLHVATLESTFRLAAGEWAPARFEPSPEIPGETWDIEVAGSSVVAATNTGLFELSAGEYKPIDTESGATAVAWYEAEQRLLMSQEKSVKLLQRSDDGWTEIARWPIESIQVRKIRQAEDGTFWIHATPASTNLYRADIRSNQDPPIWQGFPSDSPWRGIAELREELLFFRPDGVYGYQINEAGKIELERDHRFDGQWLKDLLNDNRVRAIQADRNDRVWLAELYRVGEIEVGPDGTFIRSRPPLQLPWRIGLLVAADPEADALWLVTEEGLLRLDTESARIVPQPYSPLVRLRLPERYTEQAEASGSSSLSVLPHGLDPLRFEFAAPHFVNEELVEYQQRLVGYDQSWSDWSRESHREYTNLPGHRYRFEVRARYAGEQIGEVSSTSFQVLPPWHLRWWAISLWLFLLAAAIVGYARLRSWKLERQARVLEARVEEEMQARHALETRMQESQRLESLGVLAGGVAHDFNNFLAVTMGNAEILRYRAGEKKPGISNMLDQIITASQRASGLCTQLLAYAGKAPFASCKLDLSDHVRQMHDLMKSSVSSNVQFDLDLQANLSLVQADFTQAEQVIVNLILNAAEACHDRPGRIRLATSECELTDSDLRRGHLHGYPAGPGRYVVIEVSDNGEGMGTEVIGRIFDPFFTTKKMGRGIGLAAVFGILRQHSAAIEVQSEKGKGSTFRVLFPALPAGEVVTPADRHAQELPVATWTAPTEGHILVIDDEAEVLTFAREALELDGLRVSAAMSGPAGLELIRLQASSLLCVLLDLTMPGMDGVATYQEIRSIAPDLPTVIMSGYSESHFLQQFPSDQRPVFLHKPFTLTQLRNAVMKAIGSY
jgi:signal transduction histidine kinase/CheY-like chemotaxis protein/sugar lactone lactonase YvrE